MAFQSSLVKHFLPFPGDLLSCGNERFSSFKVRSFSSDPTVHSDCRRHMYTAATDSPLACLAIGSDPYKLIQMASSGADIGYLSVVTEPKCFLIPLRTFSRKSTSVPSFRLYCGSFISWETFDLIEGYFDRLTRNNCVANNDTANSFGVIVDLL